MPLNRLPVRPEPIVTRAHACAAGVECLVCLFICLFVCLFVCPPLFGLFVRLGHLHGLNTRLTGRSVDKSSL